MTTGQRGGTAPRTPCCRGLGLAAWVAFLAGTVAALHAVGGPLAPPPLTTPRAVGDWLSRRQPAEVAFASLRLICLALAWYLLAATVVAAVARLWGAPPLVRAADLFTVPVVRQIVNAAAGASIAVAVVTVAGPGGGAGRTAAHAAPVDRSSPAPPPEPTLLPGAADATPVLPPTMTRLPDDPVRSPRLEPVQWEVRHGEHFWAVAEAVLARAWLRPPSDAEVDAYWRRLVQANLGILRDRANPDLLYAGQVLELPPPDA